MVCFLNTCEHKPISLGMSFSNCRRELGSNVAVAQGNIREIPSDTEPLSLCCLLDMLVKRVTYSFSCLVDPFLGIYS